MNAVTPFSSPDTITVSPNTIGVTALRVARTENGRRQSSSPVSAATPIRFSWVSVMICRTPASSATMGDPYAGPSPVHAHLIAPVFASKAVSAPLLWPPTWTITSPRSTSGDIAV